MDKFEYNAKLEEINRLAEQEEYEEAAKLADSIEWKRVRNVRTLCMVSEIYEANGQLEESKQILLRAYRRSPNGRSMLYRLTEVAVKMHEFDDAVEYYTEFVNAAPNDNNKYILKYKIYKGRGSALEEQIAILQEYKQKEYTERWAYELAKLYQKAGMDEKCVQECDDITLWFHNGSYVVKALELKKAYVALTPEQQTIYDNPSEIVDLKTKEETVTKAVPKLEKKILKGMPKTQEEAMAANIIAAAEKEIAASVSQHKLEDDNKAKFDFDEDIEKTLNMIPDGEVKVEEPVPVLPAYNTAELQVELAKNMREILSGIRKPKAEEEESQAASKMSYKDKSFSVINDEKGVEVHVERAVASSAARPVSKETMSIDDVLTSMNGASIEDNNSKESVPDVFVANIWVEENENPETEAVLEGNFENDSEEVIEEEFDKDMGEVLEEDFDEDSDEDLEEDFDEDSEEELDEDFDEGSEEELDEDSEDAVEEIFADDSEAVIGEDFDIEEDSEENVDLDSEKETPHIKTVEVDMGNTIDLAAAIEEAANTSHLKVNKNSDSGKASGNQSRVPKAVSDPMYRPAPELNAYVQKDLTPLQKETLGYFADIKGLDNQIAESIALVMHLTTRDRTSSRGNLVITGSAGSGRTTLGINMAKVISQEKRENSAKVAKIFAEDFNKKDIPATVAKIAGGTLIIEEAGDLDENAVNLLSKAMEFKTDSLLVILEDEKRYVRDMLARNPEFSKKFEVNISIPIFTNDELVEFGKKYARELDYTIDDLAIPVLYDHIGEYQAPDHPVVIGDVKAIVDKAIKHVERFGARKLFSGLSGKRYDDEDRVILYEKDFK